MRARRLVIAGVIAFGAVLAGAPAQAATAVPAAAPALDVPGAPDCKNPPVAETPDSGVAAMLDPGPDHPRIGTPWGDHPTTTLYETYRWAGLTFVDYDPGCVNQVVPTDQRVAGALANFGMTTLKFSSALSTGLMRYAYNPAKITGILDPLRDVALFAFAKKLFPALAVIAFGALAVLMAWRSDKQPLRITASWFGWAVLIAIFASTAGIWATQVGPWADSLTTTGVQLAGDAAAGVSANSTTDAGDTVGAADERLIFETWKAGNFGRTTSPVVDEYSRKLFIQGAITTRDMNLTANDPNRGKILSGLTDTMDQQFRKFADELKDKDPTSYDYLAGHHNWERLGYVTLAWGQYLASNWVVFIGGILILFGVTLVRIVAWAFPLLALPAILPKYRHRLTGAIDFAAGAVLNGILFAAVTLVWIIGTSHILDPQSGAPLPAVLLMLAIADYLAIWLLKPWQRLKGVTRHAKETGEALRRARQRAPEFPGSSHLTAEQIADMLARYGPQATAAATSNGTGTVTVTVQQPPVQSAAVLTAAAAAAGAAALTAAPAAQQQPTVPYQSRVTPTTTTSTPGGFAVTTTGTAHVVTGEVIPGSPPAERLNGAIPAPSAPASQPAREAAPLPARAPQAELPAGSSLIDEEGTEVKVWRPSDADRPVRADAPEDVVVWTPTGGEA